MRIDTGLYLGNGTITKGEVKGLHPGCVVEEVFDREAFKYAIGFHSSSIAELKEEFKRDLFEELNVVGHPKAQLCYEICLGIHDVVGDGDDEPDDELAEIYDLFSTLVKLIRP
jgi:hypothetical protein